jgi:uncharacterized phage protein (TIGR02218 family)
VPVRVRIYKTDVRSYDPELLFDGVVRKPTLSGRTVTAECSEWGEALDQRLPAFYVQPECNYRVFDSATCRASEAAFQKSVTVTTVNGRSAIVSGAGLSGAAASYYAQGRITLGEGAGRQVRFIMESSAADGTQVALTLSEPITTGVPVAATLLPGCDGTATTCEMKFANLPNFGGHATPRDNLTLVAIRANPTTGGKK